VLVQTTTIRIRSESPDDVAAIAAVTEPTFLHAAHTDHNPQFILAGLRDAGALTVSLVAEMDAAIVGHAAVTPVSISDGTAGWFGVGPVSVIPTRQSQDIGSQGAAGRVIFGDPSYYQGFGFANDDNLVLPDVPPEYFMALSFRQSKPRGTVRYHPGFGITG
jgi:putative acetyltransferase